MPNTLKSAHLPLHRAAVHAYLDAFAAFERTHGSAWRPALRHLRKAAIARLDALGFPGPRDEEYRFTPIQPLLQTPFQMAAANVHDRVDDCVALKHAIEIPDAIKLVLVNGFLARTSALQDLPKGMSIGSLAKACSEQADLVESHLGKYVKVDRMPFALLNTAFFQDGVFIHLPAQCVVERPIHLIFLSTAEQPQVNYPRQLLIAEKGSRATVLETHLSLDNGVPFTNCISEYLLDPSANIDHYQVQQTSRNGFHFSTQFARLTQGSQYRSHLLQWGGKLVRNDVMAVLDGADAECTINGLVHVDGQRLIDHHTVIDHAQPNCPSHELFKHIVDGDGQAVFNGKIFVRQDAQKTDAKQTNQTLLLSPNGRVLTKPQLEIFADDVKCTHGATVGQLEEEALFYLRSRGISQEQAQSLLTFAFANDIIHRIQLLPLRSALEHQLLAVHHLPEE